MSVCAAAFSWWIRSAANRQNGQAAGGVIVWINPVTVPADYTKSFRQVFSPAIARTESAEVAGIRVAGLYKYSLGKSDEGRGNE